MKPILTPTEMAAADAAAIESGTPVAVLMERAGKAVARVTVRVAGGRYGKRAAVICGKGNNGGDGFVAARVLQRQGMSAMCMSIGDVHSSTGAAAENLERWLRREGQILPFDAGRLAGVDVVVDAIFGTGFRGPARGEAGAAIEAINSTGIAVVAVDVPSGVDGATGRVEGPAIRARATVTMAALKMGVAVGEGAARSGRVEVADIGIALPPRVKTFMTEAADAARALPRRLPEAHKRSVGSIAVLAGSDAMPGAALLATRGAVRAGAGYATLGCTRAVQTASASLSPEILTRLSSDQEILGPGALERMKDVIERSDSVAVGPGLGTGGEQRELVEKVLREVDRPVVLDADGLNVLEGAPAALVERQAPLVLTPHPAELARLLGIVTSDVQVDRAGAAREGAARFDCVVVLKGFRSLVADGSGRAVVNPTGGPELATAGTGDVLTGVIGAFLAAGLEPFEAAWAGAYLQGMAGSLAKDRIGSPGVLAWDVAEALPLAAERLRPPD